MKHVWGLTALVLSAFAYSPAVFAAPDLKVGYVDIQKALADSRAGSAAKKEYEVEVKQAQGELCVSTGEHEGYDAWSQLRTGKLHNEQHRRNDKDQEGKQRTGQASQQSTSAICGIFKQAERELMIQPTGKGTEDDGKYYRQGREQPERSHEMRA